MTISHCGSKQVPTDFQHSFTINCAANMQQNHHYRMIKSLHYPAEYPASF